MWTDGLNKTDWQREPWIRVLDVDRDYVTENEITSTQASGVFISSQRYKVPWYESWTHPSPLLIHLLRVGCPWTLSYPSRIRGTFIHSEVSSSTSRSFTKSLLGGICPTVSSPSAITVLFRPFLRSFPFTGTGQYCLCRSPFCLSFYRALPLVLLLSETLLSFTPKKTRTSPMVTLPRVTSVLLIPSTKVT